MKKLILSVSVALGIFLSAFLTSSAMAGGLAVGIIGATGKFDASGHETEGSGDKEVTSYSQSEGLQYPSIFAEYAFGDVYGMTLGFSYTPMDSSIGAKARTDANVMLNSTATPADDGTYTAEAEISNHATLYVEPTFMPNDIFGIYLKGGIARVTVNSLESIAIGEDSSTYGDETVLGGLYGFGVKLEPDLGSLLLKLEFIRIDYEQVSMKSSTGNGNTITADPEQETVRIAIGYKF